jgi:hypothetical protein
MLNGIYDAFIPLFIIPGEQRLCIIEVLGINNHPFSFDKTRIENDASKNSSIVACVFLAAVTFLPAVA